MDDVVTASGQDILRNERSSREKRWLQSFNITFGVI